MIHSWLLPPCWVLFPIGFQDTTYRYIHYTTYIPGLAPAFLAIHSVSFTSSFLLTQLPNAEVSQDSALAHCLFLSTLLPWASCPVYSLGFHLSADIPKFISPTWTISLNSTLASICLFVTFSDSLRGIWKLASPKLNSAFPHHTIRPPPGNAIVSCSSQNFCINHPWLPSFSHPRNKALASPCTLHIQDVPWIFLFLSTSVLPPHPNYCNSLPPCLSASALVPWPPQDHLSQSR